MEYNESKITIVEIFTLLGTQTAHRYHQLSEMPRSFGVNIFTCHETGGGSVLLAQFSEIFAKLNICEKISDVLSLFVVSWNPKTQFEILEGG